MTEGQPAMTDPYRHQPQYQAGWPPCPPTRAVPKERVFGVRAVFYAIWILLSRGRNA